MPEFMVKRPNGSEDIIVSDSPEGAARDTGGTLDTVEEVKESKSDSDKEPEKKEPEKK